MQSPLLALPILNQKTVNNKGKYDKISRKRYRRDRIAWNESKHHAIVGENNIPDVSMITVFPEGFTIDEPELVLSRVAREMMAFANSKTLEELEDNAPETVVAVGEYDYNENSGYVMVYNTKKRGLGFPGGRVRFGQSPQAGLIREIDQETNLRAEVGETIIKIKVGIADEHMISGYEVVYTGGEPIARPTDEEPIIAIVFVDKETLTRACQNNAPIEIEGIGKLGVLRNHRDIFNAYIAAKNKSVSGAQKEALNV